MRPFQGNSTANALWKLLDSVAEAEPTPLRETDNNKTLKRRQCADASDPEGYTVSKVRITGLGADSTFALKVRIGQHSPFAMNDHVGQNWVQAPSFVLEGIPYIRQDGRLTNVRDVCTMIASEVSLASHGQEQVAQVVGKMRILAHHLPDHRSQCCTPLAKSAVLANLHIPEVYEIEVCRKQRDRKAGHGWQKQLSRLSHFRVKLQRNRLQQNTSFNRCAKDDIKNPERTSEYRYQALLSILRLHSAGALVLCSTATIAVNVQQKLSSLSKHQNIIVAGMVDDQGAKMHGYMDGYSQVCEAQLVIVFDEINDVSSFSRALRHLDVKVVIHLSYDYRQYIDDSYGSPFYRLGEEGCRLTKQKNYRRWHALVTQILCGCPLMKQLRQLGCKVVDLQPKKLLQSDREFAVWYYSQYAPSRTEAVWAIRNHPNDRDIVLATVSCHPPALALASEELRSDRAFVLAAIASCGDNLPRLAIFGRKEGPFGDILDEVFTIEAHGRTRRRAEFAYALLHTKTIQLEVVKDELSLVVSCTGLGGDVLACLTFLPDEQATHAARKPLLEKISRELSLPVASLSQVLLPSGSRLMDAATGASLRELLQLPPSTRDDLRRESAEWLSRWKGVAHSTHSLCSFGVVAMCRHCGVVGNNPAKPGCLHASCTVPLGRSRSTSQQRRKEAAGKMLEDLSSGVHPNTHERLGGEWIPC